MTRTNRECITFCFCILFVLKKKKNLCATGSQGAVRESNPRPLPPEGRIIPLDQRPGTASSEDRTRDLALTKRMLCQLSYRGDRRAGARVEAAAGPRAKGCAKKNMLDGIRTRNPQIRSLVRYPLRHEHLLERGQQGRNGVASVLTKNKNGGGEKNLIDN